MVFNLVIIIININGKVREKGVNFGVRFWHSFRKREGHSHFIINIVNRLYII